MAFRWVSGITAIALTILLRTVAPAAAAPPMVVADGFTRQSLGLAVDYLKDDSRDLTVADMANPQVAGRFLPSHNDSPAFGFTTSAYWLRCTLTSALSASGEFFLEIDYPLLDSVILYQPDGAGGYRTMATGDKLPFRARPIHSRNFVFPVKLVPGESRTLYLRCVTTSSMNLPMTLFAPEAFARRVAVEQGLLGLYYGILITMIIFSIFVYANLRDTVYLHYMLFISAYMFFQLGLNGLSFQYLWPEAVWWANNNIPVFIFISFAFANLFTRKALDTRHTAPRLDLLLLLVAGVSLLGVVYSFYGDYAHCIRFATALNFSVVLLIATGIVALMQGQRPALYYCIAWIAFLVGVVVYALKTFGMLPVTFWTEWGLQIGSAWEVVFLFMGLSERLRLMENERINLQADYARRLEKTVADRTDDLRRVNEFLSKEVFDRKVAEQRAAAASRAKSEFLANMSHEIRTPMNAVLGMANLALRQEMAPKLREYLKVIRDSGNSLLDIINEILDFSKIEAGRLDLEQIGFDLNEVLEEVSNLFSGRIFEKKGAVEMFVVLDPEVPCQLVGDPLRLKQILINLINNAIKFTSRGEITVRIDLVARQSDTITIGFEVKDTGIGIDQSHIDRLFESFSQADTSVSRRFGGTGLGLAISKRLARLMGGDIVATSVPGKGSSFRVTVRFSLQEVDERQPLALPPALQAMQVLVIDDNENLCKVARRMLESFGATARSVLSGEAALELLREPGRPFAPDMVIVDLMMPGINGIRTAEAIRVLSGDHRMPILMISGIGNEQVLQDSGSSAVDAFLHKPFTRGRLFQKVLAVMGRGEGAEVPGGRGTEIANGVSPDTFAGRTILVAEDNAINQQMAREILENGGFTVDMVANGYEALARLRQQRYDAVLMDVQMPEMDGFEATRRIRQELGLAQLPVIAMTAHAVKGYREKCLAAGMNDYVPKPIEVDLLFDTLRRWVLPGADSGPASPAAPAGEADDEAGHLIALLRPFSGLNVPDALARLGGNTMIYRGLLADFAREYGQAAARYQALIEQGEYHEAERTAHTIKGLAGNCGAESLAALARELEVAAGERRLDGLAETCERFEATLREVLAAATLLAPEDAAPPPAKGNRDPVVLVGELYVQLVEQNVAAEGVFRELRGYLTDEPGRAAQVDLELQLGLFDFAAARKTVTELARQWGIDLPGGDAG